MRIGRFWRHAVLTALFLLTLVFQAAHVTYTLDVVEHRRWAVANPFWVHDSEPVIFQNTPQGETAGIREGDRLLAVEDRPYRGLADLVQRLDVAKPAETMSVTVQRDGTGSLAVAVPLSARPVPTYLWVFLVPLGIVLPLACVALAFTVAALRPEKSLAWLMMALLLSFSHVFQHGWAFQRGGLLNLYAVLAAMSWPVWLFLFGIHFPSRLPLDRRQPWLKWLLLAPSILFLFLNALLVLAPVWSFSLSAHLVRAFGAAKGWIISLSLASSLSCIAASFALLGIRYFLETLPDPRRRLRVLFAGLLSALLPALLMTLVGFCIGKRPDDLSPWIEVPCLLATLLLPLTFAYLVLVHRALDVSVVLRQGIQYALARGGLLLLQAALILALAALIAREASASRAHLLLTTALVAGAMILTLQLQRILRPLALWIDRRFFREAYDAEQVLTNLSSRVRTMIEAKSLVETVAGSIVRCLHVPCIAVMLESAGPYQLAYATGYGEPLECRFPKTGAARHLSLRKEPTAVYLSDPQNWINRDPDVSAEERSELAKLKTELLLPLLAKEHLIGFICLAPKQSEAAFSPSDLRLLDTVAAQTALALEVSRLSEAVAASERLKRELEIARDVQQHLFPQIHTAIPGVEYAGSCRPALGVGGDYYDFLELPGGRLGLAIGDVSGKGISAALLMSNLQAALRSQSMGGTEDLAAMLGRINTLIHRTSSANRYATLFLSEYSPADHKLRYVNAGHNPPMLLHADGRVERLDQSSTPIGLFPQCVYREAQIELEPGSLLVAFTDGVSESMNSADEEWGEDSLLEAIQKAQELPPHELAEQLLLKAEAFAGGAPQHDDMTLLIAKVNLA